MSKKHEQQGLLVNELSVRYGNVIALSDVTLAIAPGEHVVIVGPSGSGKSTLLRCAAGLLLPDRGMIQWEGRTWTNAATKESVAPEARRIGMMTQHPALWPHLNARKHLLLALKWRGVNRRDRSAEADRLLNLVSLAHRAEHRPSELSGGEAQRLALARALCGGSKLLLLDEPLGQLDLLLRNGLAQEIRRIAAETKATVLHVTHDPAIISEGADRIGVLESGRLVQLDTVANLHSAPATPFAAAVARSAVVL